MSIDTIIAIIGSISTLSAAIAAWVQIKKLKAPVNEINNAVNHRKDGEKRLVEMVENIESEVIDLKLDRRADSLKIDRIGHELEKHQAYHQKQAEGKP